jgi:hypothetical protein
MVRGVAIVFFVLFVSLPAAAQDDEYPRVETTMGYANLTFQDFENPFSTENRHRSGFAMHNALNLTRWLGFENYTGIYGLGAGVSLISNIAGGKLMLRQDRVVPYAVGGLGVAYFTSGSSYGSVFSTRVGGGVDIPLGESMSYKVDVSRMFFKGIDSYLNFSTGITFNLSF